MKRTWIWLIGLVSGPGLAQAGYAPLDQIDAAVVQFTGAEQGMPGGAVSPVDRRLRLAPCRQALTVQWQGLEHKSVAVSCPTGAGWRVYVALVASASAPSAAQPPAVLRGDSVTIAVTDTGFAVSQPGEALEGGPVGAWIRVRGLSQPAPVLRARVLRPGVVGIDLP